MPPHWVKALHHLKQYNPDNFDYVAPPDLTQDGIAEAIGISRAHAALVLRRLMDEGYVESRLLYIRGGSRRRKAYVLNHIGIKVVMAM